MKAAQIWERMPCANLAKVNYGNDLYSSPPMRVGDQGTFAWQKAQRVLAPTMHLQLLGMQGQAAIVSLQTPVQLQALFPKLLGQYSHAYWLQIVQSVLGDVLDGIELSLGMRLQVVGGGLGIEGADALEWNFEFEFNQRELYPPGPLDVTCVRGCVCAGPEFWRSAVVNRRTGLHQDGMHSPLWQAQARMGFDLVLGSTRLMGSDLKEIEVGGWVRIERHGFAPSGGGQFMLRGRAIAIRCEVQIHLDGKVFMSDNPYAAEFAEQGELSSANCDEQQPDALQMDASRLAHVPVHLRFEVGSLRVPLSHLSTVRPGYVFDLGRPIEQHVVRLMVDEVEVGQGTLVAIGDVIGVRLDTLKGASDGLPERSIGGGRGHELI
jgi:flagellar motor switch/type III secretory pathway protein FliN